MISISSDKDEKLKLTLNAYGLRRQSKEQKLHVCMCKWNMLNKQFSPMESE